MTEFIKTYNMRLGWEAVPLTKVERAMADEITDLRAALEKNESDLDAYERLCQSKDAVILDLNAALEAARKDAERYRWLRDDANAVRTRAPLVFNSDPAMPLSWLDALHGPDLDAVIDAAKDRAEWQRPAAKPSNDG